MCIQTSVCQTEQESFLLNEMLLPPVKQLIVGIAIFRMYQNVEAAYSVVKNIDLLIHIKSEYFKLF